jgi:hypothetical protein
MVYLDGGFAMNCLVSAVFHKAPGAQHATDGLDQRMARVIRTFELCALSRNADLDLIAMHPSSLWAKSRLWTRSPTGGFYWPSGRSAGTLPAAAKLAPQGSKLIGVQPAAQRHCRPACSPTHSLGDDPGLFRRSAPLSRTPVINSTRREVSVYVGRLSGKRFARRTSSRRPYHQQRPTPDGWGQRYASKNAHNRSSADAFLCFICFSALICIIVAFDALT